MWGFYLGLSDSGELVGVAYRGRLLFIYHKHILLILCMCLI
jgi:hypothetical protein